MRKDIVKDLKKVRDDVDTVVESIELMSDKQFMSSFSRAKKQVRKREFEDWDDL